MSDVAYVICDLNDIQSQRAKGFDLAISTRPASR